MADNVDITPGSGATVAADLVAGALYQRVKLALGADGTADDLALGQALMAASLPVAIASNQTAVSVKTDQTTHGTTDLVAADITKVAGSAISQGHGTAATAIRVELPTDGTGAVNINTAGYTSSVALTRPSDTTAYAAGDVVGSTSGSAILSFTSAGPSGGHVLISGADLRIDLNAVPSGMTSFRLHLYDASPTAVADNAAWDLASGDRSAYLGYVDFGTPVDVGSTLFVQADQLNKKVKLATASTTLYGLLVTNGAYTPTSAATLGVRLQTLGV